MIFLKQNQNLGNQDGNNQGNQGGNNQDNQNGNNQDNQDDQDGEEKILNQLARNVRQMNKADAEVFWNNLKEKLTEDNDATKLSQSTQI